MFPANSSPTPISSEKSRRFSGKPEFSRTGSIWRSPKAAQWSPTKPISKIVDRLVELKLQLHLDDFGTGYSSLSHLHRIPVSTLKIDRSFISGMGADPACRSIVQAIVTLAHALKMGVIAEGVETPQQLAFLQSINCDFAQGFLFASPLAADQIVNFLKQARHSQAASALIRRAKPEYPGGLPKDLNMKIKTLVLACFLAFGAGALFADDAGKQPEVVLGMSTALTGPASDLGREMRQGVVAGIERANRAGGVHGFHLRLITLDDGYEPARTAPNMRELLEKDNVLAIIGNVGTPTAIAAVPIANEEKTLFFAGFTGAGVLRKNPPDHYVINYRASYGEETGSMIGALIDRAGLKPDEIAFFTQRDGYGDAGFEGGIAALQAHGLKDPNQVCTSRYERNTLAVENAVATLLFAAHKPRAIVMVGAYAPCAKFIRLAHDGGLDALFLNVSFVGSDPAGRGLGRFAG